MKSRFTQIILNFLVIGMIFMLSGFCIFQLLPNQLTKINVAQAADNRTSNISNDVGACEGEHSTEKDSKQALPISSSHSQSSLLPCCIDNSHNGVASIIQSVESGQLIPIVFSPQNELKTPPPHISFVYNRVISPPSLSLIKNTILRL